MDHHFGIGQRWLIVGLGTGIIYKIEKDPLGDWLIRLQRDFDSQYHVARPCELSSKYTPDMIGKDLTLGKL